MKRSGTKIPVLITIIMLVVVVAGTTTFAWLAGNRIIDCDVVSGSILTQYFHCGTGTERDPFVITRPIHYYNLVYLYQRLEGFADEHYYFQLGYDLDKDGETLEFFNYNDDGTYDSGYSYELNMKAYDGVLPVGTSSTPFNGTFDGKNLTIKNLTVISSETINGVTYGSCDIGVFGYVNGSATIRDTYYKNLTIKLKDADATATCESGTTLHDTDMNGTGDIVYVGYIAGHIKTSSNVENVYVNDCTISGGTNALSNFGYFGCVEDSTGSQVETLGTAIAKLRGAGDESGFGGSLNLTDLYNRIKNVLNNNTYNGTSRLTTYPTAETVVEPDNNEGMATISDTNTAALGTITKSGGGTEQIYRWTKGSSGNYIGSVSGSYTYLYGLTEARTTEVATVTKTGELVDAYLISNNNRYLDASQSGITSVMAEASAAKWIEDVNHHFYTYINATIYYLNANTSTGEVSLYAGAVNGATVWNQNENDEIYVTDNGVNYFLIYTNGHWELTKVKQYYSISDGNDHYLTATTSAVQSTANPESAALWQLSNPTGNTQIFFYSGANTYYLSFDDGRLSVSTTPMTWIKEGNSYYYESDSVKYYLCYSNGWCLTRLDGFKIYVGGVYLSANTSEIIIANENSSVTWYSTSSGKIYTIINNQKYYLTYNSANGLTVSNSDGVSWTKSGNSYYCTVGGKSYYLKYEASEMHWNAINLVLFYISDGSGNYLKYDYTNTRDQSEATLWTFENEGNAPSGRIVYINGSTKYYLGYGYSNGAAVLSNTATSWVNSNNQLSYTQGSTTYYLGYSATSGWRLTPSDRVYKISSGQSYLKYNGRAGENGTGFTSSEVGTATEWVFSNPGTNPSGTIYASNSSGTKHYLSINQTTSGSGCDKSYSYALRTNTATASWNNTNNQLSLTFSEDDNQVTKYLRYSNSSWNNGNAATLTITEISYDTTLLIERHTLATPEVSESAVSVSKPTVEVTTESFDTQIVFTDVKEQLYDTTNSTVRRSSYIPLRTISDDGDATNDKYNVSNKNTGYIIGGTYSAASGSGRGDIRVSSYGISEISGSYSNQAFTTIYTYNGSGSPVAIANENSYVQYEGVLSKFLEILKKDPNNVYGLHFMESQISKSHVIKAESATILGKTYVNYDLPESSIDFNVVERGYITFMAGGYYSGNNAFFSLHQIERDETTQEITNIYEIKEVWQHQTLGMAKPYVYRYSNNKVSDAVTGEITNSETIPDGYVKVFDTSWITNPTNGNTAINSNYIYYFEIPCNDGEYALGSVDGKTGAYLLYLDIATNGGALLDSVVSDEGNDITESFDVDYRYRPSQSDYSVLQFSFNAPSTVDTSKLSVSVNFNSNVSGEIYGPDLFSNGIYTITVTNKTGTSVDLYVLLCNLDASAPFNYAYRVKYINETHGSETTITSTAGYDFYKSVAGFTIPSTGNASEKSYSS